MRRLSRFLTAIAALLMGLCLGACTGSVVPPPKTTPVPANTRPPSPSPATPAPTPTPATPVSHDSPELLKDLVDTAAADGRFTTLLEIVETADAVDVLKDKGPFTVFAPTNEAFARLPADTLEKLLATPETLIDLLFYHVVPGKLTAADLAGQVSLETLATGGFPVAISVGVDGRLFVENATVVDADIDASNGVLHAIDTVLVQILGSGFRQEGAPIQPASPEDMGTITGALSFPSEQIPQMKVYARRVGTDESYSVETESNETSYAIQVPPGEYQVFAYTITLMAGGYTQAVPCGLTSECTDHSLIVVNVPAGETVRGVDVIDWYAPPESFPPPSVASPPPPVLTPAPIPICTVVFDPLNLRTGPDTGYPLVREPLLENTRLEAMARSPDGQWVWGRVQDSGEIGWVASEFISCSVDPLNLLLPPIVPPPASSVEMPLQVHTLLVAPGEPGRLYALLANQSGPLWAYRATDVHFLISDDFAETWTPFDGGLPVPPDCMINVYLAPSTPDAPYASTCQGIYFWDGQGWMRRSDRETNVVAVVNGQPAIIWAAEPWKTMVRSNDGGLTWHPADAGLLSFGGIANLIIDPRDANVLYAIIQPKYAGSYLRRGTGDGQWVTMPTPLDNTTLDTGLAIDGSTGALYVTTQSQPAQLWRSPNPNTPGIDDVTWELVHDFGFDTHASLLAAGWGPAGLALYANLRPVQPMELGGVKHGDPVMHRSLDGGQTWTVLSLP